MAVKGGAAAGRRAVGAGGQLRWGAAEPLNGRRARTCIACRARGLLERLYRRLRLRSGASRSVSVMLIVSVHEVYDWNKGCHVKLKDLNE